jgi:hypothetical protein
MRDRYPSNRLERGTSAEGWRLFVAGLANYVLAVPLILVGVLGLTIWPTATHSGESVPYAVIGCGLAILLLAMIRISQARRARRAHRARQQADLES